MINGCSRGLVGRPVADHMRTDLVAGAPHADHCDRCCSKDFAAPSEQLAVVRSMGKAGSGADNAVVECSDLAEARHRRPPAESGQSLIFVNLGITSTRDRSQG